MSNLCEVEFGDPSLHTVHLVRKYKLNGVAFVKDKKPIAFFFMSPSLGCFELEMEPLYHTKKLYDFFKEIFRESIAPMSKNWGIVGNSLKVEWRLKAENKGIILQNIEKKMSIEWKKAFDTLFSVHGI